jgi:hypothetical protein
VTRRAGASAAGSLVLAMVLVSGCVPASPDEDTYRGKASVTVGGARSEVGTAQKTLDALRHDRTFRPTAVVALRDSRSSLGTNASAFHEVNPPQSLDGLYRRIDRALSDAADAVQQAVLAVHRQQVGRYARIAADLGGVANRLARLERATS